jgi:hypothetical protein
MAAPVDPPGWPTLPLAATLAVLLAITPAWIAPEPPDRIAPTPRRDAASPAAADREAVLA